MSLTKRMLITGASGFVGTWLAAEAVKAGYSIIGIDIRSPYQPQLWEAFATTSLETVDLVQLLDERPLSAVCHLAGSASVAASVTDPYGDFYSLMPGTARLALYIVRNQPQARMFLFSSAAVYGNPQALPITESSSAMPLSPYGIHKAVAESLLLHYRRIYDLKITIFRIFSIFGPGLRKQLIWDISQKAFSAVTNGEKSILLSGSGQESRDFIFVKDLCKAALMVIGDEKCENGEIFNIASGQESTIQQVASLLIKQLNVPIEVKFNGIVPSGDPLNWRADISKLSNMQFELDFTLEGGLKQVADWANSVFKQGIK